MMSNHVMHMLMALGDCDLAFSNTVASNFAHPTNCEEFLLKILANCHTANCVLSMLCLRIGVLSTAHSQSNF